MDTSGGHGESLENLSMTEVKSRLGWSKDGLTQSEATERLASNGPNELEEKKENQLLKLLGYFWGPIPWMIEIAVILSGVLRHWPDFIIILVLLLAVNGHRFLPTGGHLNSPGMAIVLPRYGHGIPHPRARVTWSEASPPSRWLRPEGGWTLPRSGPHGHGAADDRRGRWRGSVA